MKLSLVVVAFLLQCEPLVAKDTGHFWHVTDFHYDPTYWTSQLSCSDEVPQPGQFGDQWCDSPWLLVENTILNMARLKPDVDFILWTGDNVAHIEDENMTLGIYLDILANITTALNDSFRGVLVYATLGNHDVYPTNQADYKTSEIYTAVGAMWEDWIRNHSQVEQFSKGGYYMARVASKIRLLALNTNLYYTKNKLTGTIEDPAGQMAWMTNQLKEARSRNEKVIVTGHIPPSLATPRLADWFYPKHKTKFVNILLEYSDVIVASHFGHEHSDGFKIVQNRNGTKAVPQFTAPSVTPWRFKTTLGLTGEAHNPGVRLVHYDKDTGEHFDYVQYFINITESNKHNNTIWTKLYSFNEEYHVKNMGVVALREIFTQMESNKGSEYVNKYCTNSVVSNYPLTCIDSTRAEVYCAGLRYDLMEAQECKQQYLKSLNGASLHGLSSCIIAVSILVKVFVIFQ